jgi:hypothetical protein
MSQRQAFHFVMIKPSHYDDDGYPILWARSDIPSNTLAALNGLAATGRQPKFAREIADEPPGASI